MPAVIVLLTAQLSFVLDVLDDSCFLFKLTTKGWNDSKCSSPCNQLRGLIWDLGLRAFEVVSIDVNIFS